MATFSPWRGPSWLRLVHGPSANGAARISGEAAQRLPSTWPAQPLLLVPDQMLGSLEVLGMSAASVGTDGRAVGWSPMQLHWMHWFNAHCDCANPLSWSFLPQFSPLSKEYTCEKMFHFKTNKVRCLFQPFQTDKFQFIQNEAHAVCAVCCESVVCHTSRVQWHFQMKHKKTLFLMKQTR